MLEKRDLQLVRLAVRRKWLTAEEGEDCLFLKRKLGTKYTIEEVIRKRGYLDDAAIEELASATADLTRRRPVAPVRRAPAAGPAARVAGRAPPRTAAPEPPTMESVPPEPEAALPRSTTRVPSGRGWGGSPAPQERPGTAGRDLPTATARGAAPRGAPSVARPARTTAPPAADPRAATQLPRAETELPRGVRARGAPAPSRDEDQAAERTLLEMPALNFPTGSPLPEVAPEEATVLGMAAITPEMLADFEVGGGTEEKTIVGLRVEDLVRARARDVTQPPAVVLRSPMDVPGAAPARWATRAPSMQARPPVMRVQSMYGPPPTEWGGGEESVTGPSLFGLDMGLPEGASDQLVRPVDLDVGDGRAEPADDESLSGTLGPYAIRRLIGRGSMGVVYLAEPLDGGDAVALKLLRRDLLSSPEHLERFRREAYAAAAIDSPYVVPVMGVGSVEGRPYIALRYIDGFTLRERLDADEPPELAEALRIARDVARALVAAQVAGIVHRDVKPENVIVTGSGAVFLTDFGLAREASAGVDGLTSISDTVVGTPNYMAPEQAIGAPVDHRTDLYALGATLFHVLAGRPPFSGRSSVSIIAKHVREPAPDLATIDPQIPPAVAAIIQRLMAKVPDQRFASAADLEAALDEVLATLAPIAPASDRVVGRVAVRTFAAASALLAASMGLAVLARTRGLALWGRPGIGVETALSGAALVIFALLMLGVIGLVRRGELPLPGSTSWLVSIKDGTGVIGAGAALASAALGPPAALDVLVLALGAIVLSSWVFGYLLRRAIAGQRKDRGGHLLALFGDLRLRRWRRVHVPLLMSLAGLATARFAALAYFKS